MDKPSGEGEGDAYEDGQEPARQSEKREKKKMPKSMPHSMKNKNKKGLIGGQKKLDKNKNGKLDRQDFMMMRQKRKGKKKAKK